MCLFLLDIVSSCVLCFICLFCLVAPEVLERGKIQKEKAKAKAKAKAAEKAKAKSNLNRNSTTSTSDNSSSNNARTDQQANRNFMNTSVILSNTLPEPPSIAVVQPNTTGTFRCLNNRVICCLVTNFICVM